MQASLPADDLLALYQTISMLADHASDHLNQLNEASSDVNPDGIEVTHSDN